jgi:hypothetical protein
MTQGLTPTLMYLIQAVLFLQKARQLSRTQVVCALGLADGLFPLEINCSANL